MANSVNAPQPIIQFILKSSQIYYKGKILVYDPQDIDKLVESLPSVWWNDKDKIVYFTFYEDGTYHCEREKTVYNYSIKDYTSIVYEFNILSAEEARSVFIALCDFFEEVYTRKLAEEKETIRNKLEQDFDYIISDFIGNRNKMLEFSDWTQLPDVQSNMDETSKQMWIKYRQYLRDMTDLQDWKDGNYYNIVFPLPPNDILSSLPETTVDDYLTKENHFTYLFTMLVNNRVTNFLEEIVMLSSSAYDDTLQSLMNEPETKTIDEYKQVLKKINERMEIINPSFKFSIKISVNDVKYEVDENGVTKIEETDNTDSVKVIDALIEQNL